MCLLLSVLSIPANAKPDDNSPGRPEVVFPMNSKSVTVLRYKTGVVDVCFTHPKDFLGFFPGLRTVGKVRAITFFGSTITDAELAMMPALSSLECLRIRNEPAVTDEGLRSLAEFPSLWSIALEETRVSGAGFKHFVTDEKGITRTPRLREVLLSRNKTTDEGLREIARVISLKKAFISAAEVTGAGLQTHLPKLRNLEQLSVDVNGATTLEGVLELQRRMPWCEVRSMVRWGAKAAASSTNGAGDPFAKPRRN
jgi:hypothetical protein